MSHTRFRVNPHSIVAGMSRNSTRTHSSLVHKQTLSHLAKLAKCLSVCLRAKWSWVQVSLQSLTKCKSIVCWSWKFGNHLYVNLWPSKLLITLKVLSDIFWLFSKSTREHLWNSVKCFFILLQNFFSLLRHSNFRF